MAADTLRGFGNLMLLVFILQADLRYGTDA
jgi:hypothetical protein